MNSAKIKEKNPLILTQIAARLHDIFDGYIDLSDIKQKPSAQREQFFTTRAYMALFILHEMRLSPADAAACITDGGADDGIDLVYVDRANARIYFGQSKWRSDMNKGVELSDFTRFRDGVKNVLSLTWTKENANLHRLKSQIEQQLRNIDTEVVMVLAHTSEQPMPKNIEAKVKQFLDESNKFTADYVSFKEFTIPQATKIARSHTRPENISVSVMLSHWGMLPTPYKAVYGSISALDVVRWYDEHGNKLFAENLRYGIERSDVNEGIIGTAETDPEKFWYYNNGITAICDAVEKLPMGGTDTGSGIFDAKRISVINGAQTITSLHKAKQLGSDLQKIRVHLRIISLSETPEGFASEVTSANNTQNNLNPVDFVAADPNQERIRKEAAQLGVTYAFRRGDKEPERNAGFNIRTATVAAACATGDLRLAVSAKRYISGLWENTKKEPYTPLFNHNTTAAYLWALVLITHAVDDTLAEQGGKLSGREKLVSVHANRFILYYVFSKMDLDALVGDNEKFVMHEQTASNLTKACLDSLNKAISEHFTEAYPGNIFKNQERQEELLALL